MNALSTATLLHTFTLAASPLLQLRFTAESIFSQILHSSVGSKASRDLGEQGHLRLLHRLHHGAGYALPGPRPPHSHAGKTQVLQIVSIEQCFLFLCLKFHMAFNVFMCTAHLFPQLFGNIWLSMASLVIFMQLRYLFHEVQRRLRRHKNYLRVINNMEAR